MTRVFPILGFLSLTAFPAQAADYAAVRDKAAFLSLVDGRELRIGLYDLSLRLTPDGAISGSALGWDITGSWAWKDGYFCREMDWSGTAIPYNCQLVEARGDTDIRFTVDQGAGQSAVLKLR
ncbi:MAG: dihydrodipicolinate reductase [Pseudomonadota bacterium]